MSLSDVVFIFLLLAVLIPTAATLVWVERRMLGSWQDRYGPNRVGPMAYYSHSPI